MDDMKERKINVSVLVSGGGTNLGAIIEHQKSGFMPHVNPVAVISSKSDAFALTRAKNAGIPAYTVVRKGVSREDFEAGIEKILEVTKTELIVLAGFMCILSADFTSRWENRIINVHPSLIPSFCGEGYYGLRVHEAALEYGVKVTGATVHFVNEIPDGGKIIAQRAVYVKDGDTPETLQQRVMEEAEWIILPEAVEKVAAELARDDA
ncbi:MAG: phosphoribosylglycinamide formyltransferase [Firmicutes bacterium]|nr:phosphoribosylglycinamide formyltransferase [Bacillota bacterium]MCD8315367.1 phosphoribosylglycinamide formyltransferase [Bacillota bacterium]